MALVALMNRGKIRQLSSTRTLTTILLKDYSMVYGSDNYYSALILKNREWVSGGDSLGISGDDAGSSVTLPFPVVIYGTNVSAVYLSTNGLLRWDNVADNRYNNYLDTSHCILAALWDDFTTANRPDGGIYRILGSDALGEYVGYRWAMCYINSNLKADFEILLYKSGYIQFNIYQFQYIYSPTEYNANEFISKGDGTNYIDLTPRRPYMESILFVPKDKFKPPIR